LPTGHRFEDPFVVGTASGAGDTTILAADPAGGNPASILIGVAFASYVESLDDGLANSSTHGLTISTPNTTGTTASTAFGKSIGTDMAPDGEDGDALPDGDVDGLDFLITDPTGFTAAVANVDQGQLFVGGFGTPVVFNLQGDGAISANFGDPMVLGDPLTINTLDGGDTPGINFFSFVDSQAGEANGLTVNLAGAERVIFHRSIGEGDTSFLAGTLVFATNAAGLGSLTIDAGESDGAGANGDGILEIRGTEVDLADGLVRTSGDQLFNGAVEMNETISGDTTFESTAAGNVRFLALLDELTGGPAFNPQDITIVSSGETQFGDEASAVDEVGATTPLGSITTDAPGTTIIFADITTDAGTQTYNDPVLVAADATLTDTGTSGIFFNNTVDNYFNGGAVTDRYHLTVTTTNATAVVQFGDGTGDDRVGSVTPLGELTVNVNAASNIIVRASQNVAAAGAEGLVETTSTGTNTPTGNQTFNGDVLISALVDDPGGVIGNTTFMGNDITFAGTINAFPTPPDDGVSATLAEKLTIASTGTIDLQGAIGNLNETDGGGDDDQWIASVMLSFSTKLLLQDHILVDGGDILFDGLNTGRIVLMRDFNADPFTNRITLDTNTDDLGVSGNVIMKDVVGVSAENTGLVTADQQVLEIETLSTDSPGGNVVLAGFDSETVSGMGGEFVNQLRIDASGSTATAITGNSGRTILTDDIELDDNTLGDTPLFQITGNGDVVVALEANVDMAGNIIGVNDGTPAEPFVDGTVPTDGGGVSETPDGILTVDTENGDDATAGAVNWNDSNVYADGTVAGVNPVVKLTIDTSAANANTGGAVDFGLVNDNNGTDAFITNFLIDTEGAAAGIAGVTTLDRDVLLDGQPGAMAPASFIADTDLQIDTTNDTDEAGAAGDGIITIDTAQTAPSGGLIDLGGFTAGTVTNSTISAVVEGDANLTLDASAATTGGTIYLGAFGNAGGLFINDLRTTTDGATDGSTLTQFDILVDDNNLVDQADQASVIIEETTFVVLDDAASDNNQIVNIDTEQDGDASGATGGVAPDLAGAAGFVDLERAITTAEASGMPLTLNIDTSATTGLGGAVDLGLVTDADGVGGTKTFLNNLTATLSSGTGAAGATTLHDDVLLDDVGGPASQFNIVTVNSDASTGLIVIAKGAGTQLLIDTEQGNDANGGVVRFGNGLAPTLGATISGNSGGQDLFIDTSVDPAVAANFTGGNVFFGDVNADSGISSGAVAVDTGGSFLNALEVNTTGHDVAAPTQGTPGTLTIIGNGIGGITQVLTDDSAIAGNAASGQTYTTDLQLAQSVNFDTEQGNDDDGGFFNIGLFTVDGGEFITTVSATVTDVNVEIDTATTGGTGGDVDLGKFDNDVFSPTDADTDGLVFVEDLTVNNGGSVAPGTTQLHHSISLDDPSVGGADFEITGNGNVFLSPNTRSGTVFTIDTNATAAGGGADGDIDDSDPSTARGTGEGGEFTLNSSALTTDTPNVSLRIFTGSDDSTGGQVQLFTVNDADGAGMAFTTLSNLLVDTRGLADAADINDGIIHITGGAVTTRDGGDGGDDAMTLTPPLADIAGGDQVWLGPINIDSAGGTTTFTGNDIFFGWSSTTDPTFNTGVISTDILSGTPIEIDNTTINALANGENLIVDTEFDLQGGPAPTSDGFVGRTLFGGKVGSGRTAVDETGVVGFTLDVDAPMTLTTDAAIGAADGNGTTFIGANIRTVGGTMDFFDPVKLLLVDVDAIDTETIVMADTGSTGIEFHSYLNSADDPDPNTSAVPLVAMNNPDVNLTITVIDPDGAGVLEAGDIFFRKDVGENGMRRLGRVYIPTVRHVRAEGLFTAKAVVQTTGSGNTVFVDKVTTAYTAGAVQNVGGAFGAGTFNDDEDFGLDAAGDGGDISIMTDGNIAFFYGANLNAMAASTFSAGDFKAQPDNDSAGVLDIDPGNPVNLQPEQILLVNGDFTAVGGGVGAAQDGRFQLSPIGRTGNPTVATIRGAFPNPSAPLQTTDPDAMAGAGMTDVSFTGASFYIGPNEKWTTFGNLNVTVTDLAGTTPALNAATSNTLIDTPDNIIDGAAIVHGDVAALGENIRFEFPNAGGARIRVRPAGQVVPAFNGALVNDLGVDIIGLDAIFYSYTPLILTDGGAGPDPIFASQAADLDVNNVLGIYVQTDFDPVNETQFRRQTDTNDLLFNNTFAAGNVLGPLALANGNGFLSSGLALGISGAALDPSSFGSSNANAAEALAPFWATPQQVGDLLTQTIVGDFQRQLLAEFAGVDVSELSTAQKLEFLTGRELYNDLPKGVDPVKVAVARALLTENRLLFDPVSDMLSFYRDMFLEEVIDPTTGQPTLISRHIEHRRALAAALGGYGKTGDDFEAQGFVTFLRSSPEHARAYRSLVGLRTLGSKFRLIGLTPRENGQAMLAVAQRIAPEGITATQLMAAAALVEPDTNVSFDERPAPAADGDEETGGDEEGATP
jgi:hypothetical protein